MLLPVRSRSRRVDVAWVLGLAALAFAVPLAVDLRSGGLHGRIGYDGSVYYASAVALAHGVLPYRDFLLLHPPGIVLALLPFAALGAVVGDPDALALARLAWFAAGAVSAALVFVVLRRRGRWPAVLGAAAYALCVPAVVSEHTTSLEAVGSSCLLGAVALLTAGRDRRTGPVWPLVAAGALVGVSTGTKIWGAAVVLTLVGWATARLGVRRAGLVLAGAVGTTVLVCLPFFVAAPGPMWRMVVLDQLGRRRVPGGLAQRVVDVAGWSGLHGIASTRVLAGAALVLGAAALVLAVRDPVGRLAALLLVVTTAVLLATPPWSVAYTGLAAPSVALVVGSAVARLGERGRPLRAAAGVLVVAAVLGCAAVSLPALHPGSRFPGASLERVLAQVPGCVTTDDPIALVETGALRRDLALRCPVVVDPSGYSYDLQPSAARHVSRPANQQWQAFLTDHLASGRLAVVVRFRTAPGLSRATRRTIGRWPVVATVGGYQVRRPTVPPSGG
ncbi:hypothetical protein [Microlunatus flavus]|uniref:Dolichyl-phosphate-mannose-protein mannosyltransferase n=1 Tax=Microlunatus flavus TaxID=1036181 RepID=A0A1H8ZDQ2_9ACTN|nr:hypothetical protein [Microlunatus flavus]SEP62532.1 hypothetical protein SAMN05421756_101204 [Microlunatus flavus]